ncbi:MAG TPA: hypothetical protein VIF83_01175 [Gemmatimonadaceae bacterium]
MSKPTRDTAASKPPAPAPTPALDFSGILFANYQYRGERAARAANKFDIERAYLTFRLAAGDRASVRVTADVFQQTTNGNDSFYRGWVLRAKYAYLQYNFLNGKEWHAVARGGLLHTVFIDHDEQFWPRWISTTPTERAGYFSSADAGIASLVTLPRKLGEIYATVTNGPGYTSRETDRFKDYAARFTVTPWASIKGSPLTGVALSVWGYKGAVASKFVDGGFGQLGPVGEGLQRDRWGVHVGNLNPRLTFGAEYAERIEEGESGGNTFVFPRVVTDSTGRLISGYAIAHPFPAGNVLAPLGVLGRYDRVTQNADIGSRYEVVIAGLLWDVNKKVSLSADYQENTPRKLSTITPTRTWFLHAVARF